MSHPYVGPTMGMCTATDMTGRYCGQQEAANIHVGLCNCATFGNAFSCPVHTQEDYMRSMTAVSPLRDEALFRSMGYDDEQIVRMFRTIERIDAAMARHEAAEQTDVEIEDEPYVTDVVNDVAPLRGLWEEYQVWRKQVGYPPANTTEPRYQKNFALWLAQTKLWGVAGTETRWSDAGSLSREELREKLKHIRSDPSPVRQVHSVPGFDGATFTWDPDPLDP